MKAIVLAALLLLPASLPLRQAVDSFLHWPRAVERWLYNPRERTDRGLDALDKGDVKSAVRDFDSAQRLAPKDPAVLYNSGTAHLVAKDGLGAAQLLEKASGKAPPRLLPEAEYNLGNALLASGNPAGAVSAFEKSLLADPHQPDAKYNLELALRQLEKQRKEERRREQKEASQQQKPGGREQGRSTGAQRPPERKAPREAQSQASGKRQAATGEPKALKNAPKHGSVLPQFKDQPNMSAAQAAAILNAVENLERQQRREAALKRAERRSSTEKDW